MHVYGFFTDLFRLILPMRTQEIGRKAKNCGLSCYVYLPHFSVLDVATKRSRHVVISCNVYLEWRQYTIISSMCFDNLSVVFG